MKAIIRQSALLTRAKWVRPTCTTLKNTMSTTTTTLWCENVLFGGGGEGVHHHASVVPQRGSIDIDGESGVIIACRPNEDWVDAKARNPHGSHNLGPKVLSPGFIDVHTHISALGRNWEGYETATKAAAAGGITTLMGMPLNSIPSTTTLAAVALEHEQASKEKLYVDVGLWGGVISDNLHAIQELLKSPYIFGLKAFLAPLPPAAGYQAVTPEQLLKAATICGPTGKPILVHSELMTFQESQQAEKEAYTSADPSSYAAHVQSRPAKWERDAIKVVCAATNHASGFCRMHIVHLSDVQGCLRLIQHCKELVQDAYGRPLLTVETCPHYLLLDESRVANGDTRIKCFPPIRSAENRKLLWAALQSGLIDMVASDHSPCEPHMRNMQSKNFQTAWGGLSGLQYQLQATWTNAVQRQCTPADMAKWWSANPARLAGLEKYKGKIHVGYQADLCWWDPDHVGAPNDYSREYHRWKGTTYYADNVEMVGRVLGTWVKGQLVYDGLQDQHFSPVGSLLTCER